MKIILWLCKLYKIAVFKISTNSYALVTKHAVKRAEQRLQYLKLLEIAVEKVKEKGTKAVHFEYVNDQHSEYAKLYNGYIWVFGNQGTLITVYEVNKTVDLLVTRK
jgi:hypothetical protein